MNEKDTKTLLFTTKTATTDLNFKDAFAHKNAPLHVKEIAVYTSPFISVTNSFQNAQKATFLVVGFYRCV